MSPAQQDVWKAYRSAFEEFSRSVSRVQVLSASTTPDLAAIEAALLNLEKARFIYNKRRNELACHMLPASFPACAQLDSPQAYKDRVKSIAELLWEVEGRPQGTELDDWHRAEEIIRRAVAA